MDGGTAKLGDWRAPAGQLGIFLVGVFSALMLFSFGGQVLIAPVLLPGQWLIARRTTGATSVTFSAVGALLAAEVVWIPATLVWGEGASSSVAVSILAAGIVTGSLFFKWSRPRETT